MRDEEYEEETEEEESSEEDEWALDDFSTDIDFSDSGEADDTEVDDDIWGADGEPLIDASGALGGLGFALKSIDRAIGLAWRGTTFLGKTAWDIAADKIKNRDSDEGDEDEEEWEEEWEVDRSDWD